MHIKVVVHHESRHNIVSRSSWFSSARWTPLCIRQNVASLSFCSSFIFHHSFVALIRLEYHMACVRAPASLNNSTGKADGALLNYSANLTGFCLGKSSESRYSLHELVHKHTPKCHSRSRKCPCESAATRRRLATTHVVSRAWKRRRTCTCICRKKNKCRDFFLYIHIYNWEQHSRCCGLDALRNVWYYDAIYSTWPTRSYGFSFNIPRVDVENLATRSVTSDQYRWFYYLIGSATVAVVRFSASETLAITITRLRVCMWLLWAPNSFESLTCA